MLIVVKEHCYMPRLPDFDKDAESELPIFIQVNEPPTSQIACDAAIHHAFTKITALPTENTRLAMRFPGYILVPQFHQHEVESLIEHINQVKQQIAELVKVSFRNRQTAHTMVHHLFPELLYQQAIRPIHTLSLGNYSINFYWSARPIVRRLTKDEALEELEASKVFKRFDLRELDKEALGQRVEFEKCLVNSVPADKYIIERRVARVQPYYDCYAIKPIGRNKKVTCRNASLPIIIFGQAKLTCGLDSYDASKTYEKDTHASIVETPLIIRKNWFITSVPPKVKKLSLRT